MVPRNEDDGDVQVLLRSHQNEKGSFLEDGNDYI